MGYGDITAGSDAGKAFFAVYMLVSTVLVADILGKCVSIYVHDIVGEGINQKIISSTIWVHKSDLNRNGDCTEADYVSAKEKGSFEAATKLDDAELRTHSLTHSLTLLPLRFCSSSSNCRSWTRRR